jgi:hypothetical protein
VRFGAVLAVAALIGFVVWLLLRGSGSTVAQSPNPSGAGAVRAPVALLTSLAASSARPIYWAGQRADDRYELTRTTGGRVYIRYLPPGAPVGSGQPYLTIGTYPVQDAFRVTSELANQSGSINVQTAGSPAVAFYDAAKPLSVFLAYPGSAVQVEVFSPVAHEAALLVSSGAIAPVPAAGGSSGTPAVAVSPAGLRRLAVQARHAVFWAGARPGVTYELTRGVDGRIFVRYLPPRVAVGSRRPYLTVGTYPLARAYAATAAQGRRRGAVALHIGHGGIAFYRSSRPTNVFLAFPGGNVQVEVYDPAPAAARALVRADAIAPVG